MPEQQSLSEPLQPRNLPKRGGPNARRTTTAMTAATLVLLTGCSTKPVEIPTGTSSPPGISASSTETGASPPSFPPAEQLVRDLSQDPDVKTDENQISLTDLKKKYTPTDYVWLENDGDGVGNIESAPVLTLSYDPNSKELLFEDQSQNRLSKQDEFNLLSPIVTNDVLKAALATGNLDRIVFRLAKKNTDPLFTTADIFNGKFEPRDNTTPDQGVKKTIFITLPGNTDSLSLIDLNRSNSHEGLHSLLSDNSLSLNNATEPDPQAVAAWQQTCADIRAFGIEDALQHKQELLTIMEGQEKLFPTEVGKQAWKTVYDSLVNGNFNQFQPTSIDSETLNLKLPECTTFDPWQVFVRLIDYHKDLPTITGNPDDPVYNLRIRLQDKWDKIMSNSTIFTLLREGPYDQLSGSNDSNFGHTYANWDETNSIDDIMLDYPTVFAGKIKQLPDTRRPVTLRYIDLTIATLDDELSKTESGNVATPEQITLQNRLRSQYALFKAELAK